MNLKELKFRSFDKSTQAIIFDRAGIVIESDEELFSVLDNEVNIFHDTMFSGMNDLLHNLNIGEEITFDCVEADLFGRHSHYDIIIRRLSEEEGELFGLFIYDFGKQYNKILELQQERNIAEIKVRKFERENLHLSKEKEAIEQLYKELQNGGVSEYILIKADNLLINLDTNDIQYFEAYGDYVKVHTSDKTYITYKTLSNVEKTLPENQFIRVHRSFIVRLDKINNIEQSSLQIANKIIPIGKTNKAQLLDKMNHL